MLHSINRIVIIIFSSLKTLLTEKAISTFFLSTGYHIIIINIIIIIDFSFIYVQLMIKQVHCVSVIE